MSGGPDAGALFVGGGAPPAAADVDGANSVIGTFAIGTHELLPAAPAGFMWAINQAYFSSGPAGSDYSLSTDGTIVQACVLAPDSPGGFLDGATLNGGLYTTEDVTIDVAVGPVGVWINVALLPLDAPFNRFLAGNISDSYVPLNVPAPPPGFAYVTPRSASTNAWAYNAQQSFAYSALANPLDVQPIFRITRGADSFEFVGYFVAQEVRNGFMPPLLAILPGDIVEVKTDLPTVAAYTLGGLLELVPILAL